MNCKKCEKIIPDDALYCCYCGVKQVQDRSTRKRGNGEGSVYKRGNTYEAQVTYYVAGNRKRVRKGGFKRKKDALEWLQQDSKIATTATFAKLYDDWVNSSAQKLSDSKRTSYKIAFKRIEKLENTDITLISIRDLQELIDGLSYYQSRDIKNLLSHLYKRAIAEGYVQTNLSTYMELPQLVEEEKIPYNEEEIAKLWDAYSKGDRFCAFPLLMIYTGMMPGELLQCTIDNVDFENQKIVGAGLKTKERKKRPIMVPDIAMPVLRDIFQGEPYGKKEHMWYKDYHAMAERVGIRDLPPYACRHTTATALSLADKVAPLAITRIMRQTRVTTTERYQHAEEQQVLNALNESFSTTHR